MRGGHGKRFADAESMKFAAGDRGIETFGLVDDEPDAFGVAPGEVRHVLVRSSQAFAAVDHHDGSIGLFQCALRLFDHAFINTDLAAGDTARIDNEVGNAADFAESVLPVSGQAWIVCNERIT